MGLSGLAAQIWAASCILVLIGVNGKWTWVAAFLLGEYVYTSIMLWKTTFARRVAPVELMFWLFHTNFLLLPALSQTLSRKYYWSSYDAYRQSSLMFACAIVALGLLAFRVGTAYGRSRKSGSIKVQGERHVLTRPLEITCGVQLFLIAVLVGLAGVISVVGPEFFTSSRLSKVGQVESLAQFGLLLSLPRALAFGALLVSLALVVQSHRKYKKARLVTVANVFAALAVNVIINWPLSLPRFWLFGFLISLFLVMTPPRSGRWRSVLVIGMTLLQFTVLPLYSQITRDKGLIGVDLESIRLYMQHGDFDGFQSIVNVGLYIHHNGFEYGRNLGSVALFFVPRSFWSGKAEPLGTAAAEFMGYQYTNLSAPIYGEFYADYGVLSLLFGMFIVGFVVRLCDDYYDRLVTTKQFGPGVLIAGVLAGYVIILLRGSLLGVIPAVATLFGVLVIAILLANRSRPWAHVRNRDKR